MGYEFQEDDRSPKQQILDFLSVKQALLVMDNWEDLLDGAPFVSEIISVAPEVKVIATSREKLNLIGETLYTLASMAFPADETYENKLNYDAVQLLLQSAKRIKPDWEVTEDNLNDVIRICRITVGMPLAIILATSWLDMLSLEEIASEIEKSINFLASEIRDIPDRQRSIRAVFDYTWNRLEPVQRDIFMKLSVFRGGFTRHAVEAVAGASLHNLHRLTEKALISRNADGRFDVHELLRQYGETELQKSAVANAVYKAHCTYFLTYLVKLEPQIKGHGQLEALDDVNIEFENIHRAWHYALSAGLFDLIDDAVEALFWAMERRDRNRDGIILMQSATQILKTEKENEHLWAKITLRHQLLSRWNLNIDDLKQAQAILARYDDTRSQGFLNIVYAWLRYIQGDPQKAIEMGQQAYEIFESLDDKFYMAYILNRLGVYSWLVSSEAFKTYTERSIALQRMIGDENGLVWSLMNLGAIHLAYVQYEQALRILHEGLAIARRAKEPGNVTTILSMLALVYSMRGEWDDLKTVAEEAEQIAKAMQSDVSQGQADVIFGLLAISQGDFVEGTKRAKRAYDTLKRVNPIWGHVDTSASLISSTSTGSYH